MPISRLRLKAGAVFAAAVLLALAAAMPAARAAEKAFVAVTAIVEHPALDACRKGIRDALAAAGYEDGKNLKFVYESAKGSTDAATAIARKFVRDKASVIVAISTPSAQAAVAAAAAIPVVFAAVTDPLGAKLVRDMYTPGGNVTGVSDLAPVKKHIALIHKISPNARTIGILFNPNEPNSYTLVSLMKSTAMGVNMTLVRAPARTAAEVPAAAQGLVGKADVIFVPTDNTIVAALDAVIKVGLDNRIPVYAGDVDAVKRGAIAAIGVDYYNLGRQAGNIVVRILAGADPGKIAVAGVEETNLYVNPGTAAKIGVTIPEDVISQADEVVK
ncbi:MAG TPA: ABC transporter substrate-binding protein [Candidatus Angelobacter sp.]|nr:ABC transporter substrate-binding protein [Candidatus Angelobacter sp.]